MPHTAAVCDGTARVGALFGTRTSHHRDARAEYRFGMVLARCCGRTSVVAHPHQRVNASGRVRPAAWHKGHPVSSVTPRTRWSGAGAAHPTGSRLGCTLLAAWDEGRDEPGLVLTDRPATGADTARYARRMWTEQGFRAIERGCGPRHRTQCVWPGCGR